ncbi:HIT domain-containing protein [Candidatus Dojkabacteria bacterium]|nr:HIT domain-containing protein [Candidatus Dojkabacteria bacterium]
MDDCIFCKIIKGDIKSNIRYEDDNVIAFDDINPKAKVHVLVVPKKHIPDVKSITGDKTQLCKFFESIQKVIQKVELENGYKLCINSGTYQEVPHLHVHLMAD